LVGILREILNLLRLKDYLLNSLTSLKDGVAKTMVVDLSSLKDAHEA